MDTTDKYNFKLKRRKLFLSAGTGIGIYIMNKIFPFRFVKKNIMSHKPGIVVKINKYAVIRNKPDKYNV